MDHRTEIFDSLKSNGYLEPILQLDRLLSNSSWLIGGWPRSSFLGISNYVGDIDLATTLREEQVAERLDAAKYGYLRNSSNGFRIVLSDGNTVDILPVEHLSRDNDLLDALNNVNFSINSVAVKVSDNELLATDYFKQDAYERRLRVNVGFVCKKYQYRGFLKDLRFLLDYDCLVPRDDGVTTEWINKLEFAEQYRSAQSATVLLESVARKIAYLVPLNHHAWIVRGLVRSAVHCESRIWDDIDIITTARPEEIEQCLRAQSLNYTYNIFGTPKVPGHDGTLIDIWSMHAKGLRAELSAYSHNVDAISWSIQNNTFDDPLLAMAHIEARQITVQESFLKTASKDQLGYATLKALYLSLRHGYIVSPDLKRLLNEPLLATPMMRKNAIRLVKELCTILGRAHMFDWASTQAIDGTAKSLLADTVR